ncbi:hypothetical protein FB381_1813 [Nocardioides albertanoniae]|uniref:SPOR domain-containing protein n=1 Tax=Nocardioides albertanoniae TaxID=1175486 RepID=A0A543A5S9_9ACTN|nr:hypothetical protein [Nocardioides albertanoniae]TQL67924.1 hypothetical protein FB381_1813 [Nocardioides albertanoniae]
MSDEHAGEYYYCLIHKTVESYEGCKAKDRLGPYSSHAEAARALDKVEENNERWDKEDRAWEGDAGIEDK